MLNKEVFDVEEFELSLKACIGYIRRNRIYYNVYPIVRALSHAIEGLQESGKSGTCCALSRNAKDNLEKLYIQFLNKTLIF